MEAKIAARYDFTGDQAIAIGGSPGLPSLAVLSICLIVMQNGFSVIGKHAPAAAGNFNPDLGRRLAYEDAMRQLWPLEGYLLRTFLDSPIDQTAWLRHQRVL
jgi:hypothetical protein